MRKTAKRFPPFALLSVYLLTYSLYLLLPAPHAWGGDEDISIVHFAEEADWPPFTPNKFGMVKEGLSFSLMTAVFSRMDIEFDLELFPQKRLLMLLETGGKDGATVISKNKSRLQFLEFSEPLFAKKGYVYYRVDRESPVRWTEFKDLKGLKIGITAGHNYGDDFDSAVDQYNLEIFTVNKDKQGFDMLLSKRLDIFLCINLTAYHFLRDPIYKGNIVHASKSYYSKDYHIAFSKNSKAKALMPKVNALIQNLREDGTLEKLLSPYLD